MRQRDLFSVFRENRSWPEVPLCVCFIGRHQRWYIAAGEGGKGSGCHGDWRCSYAHLREGETIIEARLRRRLYKAKRRERRNRTLA